MRDSAVVWEHLFGTEARTDILLLTCAAKAGHLHGLDLQREIHVNYCTLKTFYAYNLEEASFFYCQRLFMLAAFSTLHVEP